MQPYYMIAGLVLGLLGWMLYWIGLPAIGAIAGAGAGGSLGFILSGFVQQSWAPWLFSGLGAGMGAFIGVFLIRALQLYFFFVTGAMLGGAMGWNLIGMSPVSGWVGPANGLPALATVAAVALLVGLLLVYFRRFIVAVVTSVAGAIVFTQGLPSAYQPVGLPVSLIVFMAIQVGLVGRFVDKESFDRRTRRRLREDEPGVDQAD